MSQRGPSVAAPPGFFGKVPARGDFLVRRPPAGFEAQWEAWLAGFVTAAREALGAAWPNDWLTAPLWHFSLGRSVVPPHGAAGVLVASADRVGRFFPFSVIGGALAIGGGDRARLDAWSRAAEALALDALDDGFDPDALDRALFDLGAPGSLPGAARPDGHRPLGMDGDWPDPDRDPLDDTAWHPPGADQSAWWCRGSERMQPVHLRCQGLPGALLSAAMVTGEF
jgi:type VI secretion system protein ImpM